MDLANYGLTFLIGVAIAIFETAKMLRILYSAVITESNVDFGVPEITSWQ